MSCRLDAIRGELVESFPQPMQPGILYVSIPYGTCGHLCCCGCGEEVVTPLSPARWAITYDGESVSLRPSIGNWGLACRSHYWIRSGRVQWSREFNKKEISTNRAQDTAALHNLVQSPSAPPDIVKPQPLFRRLFRRR